MKTVFSLLLCFAILSFESSAQSWVKAGALIQGDSGTQYGYLVSLSEDGNTLVVSSPLADGIGLVETYKWSGSDWISIDTLFGDALKRYFGHFALEISRDGKYLAVAGTGYYNVYVWNDGWDFMFGAEQSNASFDFQQDAVGKTALAVGEPFWTDDDTQEGRVLIYLIDGNSVTAEHEIKGVNSYANFGRSISMSNDARIIAGVASGENYLYVGYWDDEKWLTMGFLSFKNDDINPVNVSINGDGSLVALTFYDFNSSTGLLHVYENDGWSWPRVGYLNFGKFTSSSIVMNDDGNLLLLSTRDYSSIYHVTDNGLQFSNAFTEPSRTSGSSLVSNDLSGDGLTVVGSDPNSSKVQVYRFGWSASQQNFNGDQFNVYPNPSSGLVNFTDLSNHNITVFNSLGQEVEFTTLSSSDIRINAEAGIYKIKVSNANKVFWKTLIMY